MLSCARFAGVLFVRKVFSHCFQKIVYYYNRKQTVFYIFYILERFLIFDTFDPSVFIGIPPILIDCTKTNLSGLKSFYRLKFEKLVN